jgi:SAM-dependent methyltransferase
VIVRSIDEKPGRSKRYDVDLLEQLNSEYENRRLVPAPPLKTPEARHEAAVRRVRGVHRLIDLRSKAVLEIGCGEGFEVWTLGNDLDCDAYGIDVRERGAWSRLTGDRVHYVCADMSRDKPFDANTFDRVLSFAVWEHVRHPYAMLRETFEVLQPGGLAYIRANLYAGPMASHRYRDIYFPWPHLLFSDDVVKDWDVKHGRRPLGLSWVNRLSWVEYESRIVDLGFRVRHLAFQEADWDEEFYRRFEDVLGRFPRTDLSRDFFTATLEKPS